MSDDDPLQLEEDCGELGDHPPNGEKDAEALFRSLDEAWDEHSLEASDDEASVDDAIDVAMSDMDGAAPSPNGDPTHMDVSRDGSCTVGGTSRQSRPTKRCHSGACRGNHHMVQVLW